ncbi:MAG TPA: PEP-CTERM sorting domain-containing protein [Bryobacteraceae bacterium]|jgi:hypothetical protein|nr:PEP-CTERM sorting domain-containing protein [Bryobacteraceae bacterium]
MAWVADQSQNFGSVDLNTGASTTISSLGFIAAGLGEIGSTVYTGPEGGTTLYSINTLDGTLHSIGTSSISFYAFGSTNTGLYMVDTVGGLWNVNPSTGTSTFIGSTLLPMGSNSVGMSTGSNVLYLSLASNVYTINTVTGQASYVGNSGSTDFGALVTSRGSLYASSVVAPNAIYSFNNSTGAASFIADTNLANYAFGLAPIVPEPGTFGLFGIAALLAGVFAWKQHKANSAEALR